MDRPGGLAAGRHGEDDGRGAGDDVVVVANFSNLPLQNLNIGFPRQGQWHVLFNSGANLYDPGFITTLSTLRFSEPFT